MPLPLHLHLSPQVTPSSKVVGDLAQFMVSQRLEPEDVLEQVIASWLRLDCALIALRGCVPLITP